MGQGKLHIIDYDHDGDLDIVDSNTRTSVFLNNQTSFDLYDDFVDTDEDVLLWPVEIDGKYHYDFIGSHNQICSQESCTTNFYQLLDPPSSVLAYDFFQKTQGFIDSITQASFLGDYLREMPDQSRIHYQANSSTSSLGYITRNNNLSLMTGRLRGLHNGNYLGIIFNEKSLRYGHIASEVSTYSNSSTKWFGRGDAKLSLLIHETFLELNIIEIADLELSMGYLINSTRINNFIEQGSSVNLRYRDNNFKYHAKFLKFNYGIDLNDFSINFSGGKRDQVHYQRLYMNTQDGLVFESDRTISNEYLSFNIIKDFFYFQAIKSSDSKLKFVGGIQVNF